MKTSFFISAFSACFFFVSSAAMALNPAPAGLPNSPVLKKKVEQFCSQLEAAFKEGDMRKVAAMYADDASIILPSGEKIQGKKAIYEYWSSHSGARDLKMEITEVGGSGDVIYHVGKASFTSNLNGQPQTETSDFVLLWKKQADWSYKIYVNSSN